VKHFSVNRVVKTVLLTAAIGVCSLAAQLARAQAPAQAPAPTPAPAAAPAPAPGPAPVDFNRDVRPILSQACFQCHGPDEGSRKGGFRLDSREETLKVGKSGHAAVVPNQPDASELVKRITSSDPDEVMPPADAKDQLTAEQKDVLRRWVAEGAPYAGHWAFVTPQRPQLPSVAEAGWAKNPVDLFILSRLHSAGLKPSPEADRATLLRRVSLDLIGLPPSPAEIDAFINDPAPDAYEKQVERLLASPHFGEKWARHWLDAARYSDSDGYEKDLPRKQHLWRDWVINAVNRDMPYDQFIVEQVAGDLLPNPTQDQRIATGFFRNGMVNEEGAILFEQFRKEGMFDRMDTVGKSILGLTIQCAQCHTHKYDPLTHEEYYRLFAFLDNDYEAVSWIYSPEQLAQIAKIHEGTAALEAKLRADTPDWQSRQIAWEEAARKGELPWEQLQPKDPEWGGGLSHPEAQPDNSVLTLGFKANDGELWLFADTKATNLTGLRLEALTHGDLPFGGPGRSNKGTFAVSEIVVEAQKAGDAAWTPVKLVNASADFAQPEGPIPDFAKRGADDKRILGPANFLIDGKDETAWGSDRGPGRRHADLKAVMQFEQPVGYPEGTKFKVTLKFRHSGNDAHGRQTQLLGRFRLSVTGAPAPAADPLPRDVREALMVPAAQRSAEQQAAVFGYWRTTVPEFKAVNDEIDKLWATHPEGETILNLAQRLPEHKRQTAMLDRGAWDKHTKPVTPGVPAFLHPLDDPMAATAPNRLTFARWLTDKRSPTTARVAVNRAWQAIFGAGIVDPPEDFGIRASEPSHPQLLDWLAVEFMERGWSTKQLVRTIVTSAAYRQSSRVTPELLERDPANRLLARGPRFRADAEVIRDTALSAAGLLTRDRIGGPSFFPPVPESLLVLSFTKVDFWNVAPAPERYRRSLYVFRRRSLPDPLLQCFDAPNGDFSTAKRVRSNTPLAALAGMNETIMVEASQALSLRILREAPRTDAERAAYGFRLCTGRVPSGAEVEQLVALLESQRKRIADGWMNSREVTTGDPAKLPAIPDGATPTDAAAWTIVSRVLLNLDETVTKN
jgi:hypothetical protein